MLPSFYLILCSLSEASPSESEDDNDRGDAAEELKVEIAFKNPLQLSIPISNVTLLCEYSANEALPGMF